MSMLHPRPCSQPAIDHLTHELARQYNAGGTAYIYNTYQAGVLLGA